MGFKFGNLLSKSTNKFYSTLFNPDTTLGKFNRTMDPAGKMVADDAIEQTTPIVAPPTPEPLAMPDEEAVAAARRRKAAQMRGRGGRQGTIDTTVVGGDPLLGG